MSVRKGRLAAAILPALLFGMTLSFWERDATQTPERRSSPVFPATSRFLTTSADSNHALAKPLSAEASQLRRALENGLPVDLIIDENSPLTLLFRPRRALAENFQLSLGISGERLEGTPLLYEGLALPISRRVRASLALLDDTVAVVLREEGGRVAYVRHSPVTGRLEARWSNPRRHETCCTPDLSGERYAMVSEDPVIDGEALWEAAASARLEPNTAALSGFDPSTGHLDKYINTIPRASKYDQSLKDALLLLVLDKEATGPEELENLRSKASLFLATVSNVAAAYENQLGIRLLVQELIMIPDDLNIMDIPSDDAIGDFRGWVNTHRRNSFYHWSMAAKFGAGLDGNTLGIAFTQSIHNTSAVSVQRSNADWDILAHEMGHNLGSDHSQGGLMNASSLGGSTRSFFTNVTVGETSAKDIYDYSHERLEGPAPMRHPEEIPFAQDDAGTIPAGEELRLRPLDNDDTSVANGVVNSLTLEETGAVSPSGAGTVRIEGDEIVFSPASGFNGTAWFSYTVRGSVGNAGRGWLHKGDVGVEVGTPANEFDIELAPGASYSFQATTGTSGLTQPAQARVDRSRDSNTLLIIRSEPDASGTDTFRAGGRTYTLRYTAPSPKVIDDRLFFDPAQRSLSFNPLVNDEGAGERWVYPIRPVFGVGTPGKGREGIELFPTALRLVSAENLDPAKGSLSTREFDFTIDGSREKVLDSGLTFTPVPGAGGTARIRYTAEDATGKQATGLVEIILPTRIDRLLHESDPLRYLVPADNANETLWMDPAFDDGLWNVGSGPVGYENGSGYEALIATDVTAMSGQNTSLYLRIPFHADEPDAYTQLSLRLKYDDGFVAYLNGREVARANAEDAAPLSWEAEATQSNPDAQAQQFTTFDISSSVALLREGPNVLAIHALNNDLTSSDFLISAEIDAIVSGGTLAIISPAVPALQMPLHTSLVLRGRAAGAWADADLRWEVAGGDPESVILENETSSRAAARFIDPGDYQLRLTAETVEGSESQSLFVTVPPVGSALPSGVAVQTEPAQILEGRNVLLKGSVSETEGVSLHWEKLNGPGEAAFSDPTALVATAGFSQSGTYLLQLSAERDGIETFALVEVSVPDAIEGINLVAAPASNITDSGGLLEGTVFLSGHAASLRAFVGYLDGGESEEAWPIVVDGGSVEAGPFAIAVEELISGTPYTFRLLLERDEQAVWSEASAFTTIPASVEIVPLVREGDEARLLVPLDDSVDLSWMEKDFDDTAWLTVTTGVGFDDEADFSPAIQTDIGTMMRDRSPSAYLRFPFHLETTQGIESLKLMMRYDDAFVAYLNGREIDRSETAPAAELSSWNATAAAPRDDAEALTPVTFDVSARADLLVRGKNVLAIHGLNLATGNGDFLLAAALESGGRTTRFQQWLSAFPEASTTVATDPLDDPDDDGLNHLQEFAFGGHPFAVDDRAIHPRLQRNVGGGLELVYRRPPPWEAWELAIGVESSPDLRDWQLLPSPQEAFVTPLPGGYIEEVRQPLENSSVETFWRLRLALP